MKKITRKQLAKMLNVSPATVSNVLNKRPGLVSKETQSRVYALAVEHGLVTEQAQHFGRLKSNIALIMDGWSNPRFHDWVFGNIRATADFCRTHGQGVLLMYMTSWDDNYCDQMLDTEVAGALVMVPP